MFALRSILKRGAHDSGRYSLFSLDHFQAGMCRLKTLDNSTFPETLLSPLEWVWVVIW